MQSDRLAKACSKEHLSEIVGRLAYNAMLKEAKMTPKAGLVDSVSQGAHSDMDISTFIASSEALRPYMAEFVRVGFECGELAVAELLPELRKTGLLAEKAMFEATKGINTHKGMIFTMGLICGAAGWLHRKSQAVASEKIRAVITDMCRGLVDNELIAQQKSGKNPVSAGEQIFVRHGITGIRGEASQGYPTIFEHSLPYFRQSISKGSDESEALSYTLLKLMTVNCDTNLIHRGGLEGLAYVRQESAQYLNRNYSCHDDFKKSIEGFDQQLTAKHLSPGGSADLLAATWLFYQLDILSGETYR